MKATPGSAEFFTAPANEAWTRADVLRRETPSLLQARDHEGKTGVMRLYDEGEVELAHSWISAGAALNALDAEGMR